MTTHFVAEVSSNHHSDLDRCLEFVDVAAEIGCQAVKFQQFKIRELFAPEALAHAPELLAREAWELPESFSAELSARAHEREIAFSSTPFYLGAVEALEPWVDFFKVASYQLLWQDVLREVARTGKPVVLATGMATLDEVKAAVDVLGEAGCARPVLLHCVSVYPTPREEANLAAIETLRREFAVPVGWSDHTVSRSVVLRAVRAFAAEMVELHLDLEGAGGEFAGGHCWLPEAVADLVRQVRAGGAPPPSDGADGDGTKEPRAVESVERAWRTDPTDGLRPLLATRAGLEALA